MLISMSATLTRPVDQLDRLVAGVRDTIDAHADWSQTARLVADQLRVHLPGPDVLTPEQRLGTPDRAAGHTLHVEPDGTFSIIDVNGFAPRATSTASTTPVTRLRSPSTSTGPT